MFSQTATTETANYFGQSSIRILEEMEIPGVAFADRMLQTPNNVRLTFLWQAKAPHETQALVTPGAVTLRESSRSTGDLFNR
jgi:hypothetical protein